MVSWGVVRNGAGLYTSLPAYQARLRLESRAPAAYANLKEDTLRYLFTLLLFVIILIEEAFWAVFEAFSGWFERFALVRKLEEFVAARHPAVCLALFLIPVLLMLPFKLAGVWLIAHGHALDGVFVFIMAKVTGTFLAARLLAITKDKLMTIRWFAYVYGKFTAWKESVKTYVHATAAYRSYRGKRDKLNSWVAGVLQRRD